MDSGTPIPSPDASDAKLSFRKPANDAANRKYRRHSSADMSDSSSSGGSPNHERNQSPVLSKDRSKMDGSRRKNEDTDSDKQMSASYRDYHRHDDQNRHQRDAVEEARNYRKSSRSAQESRSGNHFEHSRDESYQNRARENNYSVDKYSRDNSNTGRYSRDKFDIDKSSRDKPDSRTHKSKETMEYHRHNDRHYVSDRAVSGGRYEASYRDDMRSRERDRDDLRSRERDRDDLRSRERDRYRERGDRDEKRERQRSPGDHKDDHKTFRDSRVGRDDRAVHRKETHLGSIKEMDEDMEHKRKHDDRDNNKRKDRYAGGREEEIQNEAKGLSSFRYSDGRDEHIKDKLTHAVEESSSKKHKSGHPEKPADEDDAKARASTRQVKENITNVDSEAVGSSNSQAEANQDFNAAKVAAMRAAELVNKNLVGGGASGLLSTDQKKKLLWGSKKNTSAEESGNRWDVPLFTDRDRQEKFNKLMGVKGDLKLESKPDDKDGNLRAEKQKELQLDLEKQYTAGLRRRDGRTVGLGL